MLLQDLLFFLKSRIDCHTQGYVKLYPDTVGPGHAPLKAFPDSTPPFCSPGVRFSPLLSATRMAFPRWASLPPLHTIQYLNDLNDLNDPTGVPQKKKGLVALNLPWPCVQYSNISAQAKGNAKLHSVNLGR